MRLYSLEDYAPTGRKISLRVGLVTIVAKAACRTYNAIAEREHHVLDAIKMNEMYFDEFVKSYFLRVAKFKIRHGYSPKELINQPKIAALILKTLSEEKWFNFF